MICSGTAGLLLLSMVRHSVGCGRRLLNDLNQETPVKIPLWGFQARTAGWRLTSKIADVWYVLSSKKVGTAAGFASVFREEETFRSQW